MEIKTTILYGVITGNVSVDPYGYAQSYYLTFPIEDAPEFHQHMRQVRSERNPTRPLVAVTAAKAAPRITDSSGEYDRLAKAFQIAEMRNLHRTEIFKDVPATLTVEMSDIGQLVLQAVTIDSADVMKSVKRP